MRNVIIMMVLAALTMSSCQQQKAYNNPFNDPILYAKTVKELNNVVMENNFPPIVASRNYVYAAIGAYEVIVLGDKRFKSLGGQLNGLPALPKFDTSNANLQYASCLLYTSRCV